MKRAAMMTACGLGVMVLLVGCNKPDQRIAILEQQNNDLSVQLDKMRGENHSAVDHAAERAADLEQRLLASTLEADRLRGLITEMETEQEAPPGWTAVPGGAMIAIEGSVLFASGKTVLRDQAERTLDVLASTISGQYADKDILVFGHTDDAPIKKSGWDDNWQLSTERSLAVVRALCERQIPPGRLAACGCGEFRPVAGNRQDTDRARNRRVEIFALDAQPRTGRP